MVSLQRLAFCSALFLLGGCEDEEEEPCAGVECSGHGSCVELDDAAACVCDAGYHADELECVQDEDPCDAVECSGHGSCAVLEGGAACICDDAYHAQELECVADVDPCEGMECSGHGSCVVLAGAPACLCDDGYHAEELECAADEDPCAGTDCGEGICRVFEGDPVCDCRRFHRPSGATCIEEGLPDIVLQEVTAEPATVAVGEDVWIGVWARNAGEGGCTQILVGVTSSVYGIEANFDYCMHFVDTLFSCAALGAPPYFMPEQQSHFVAGNLVFEAPGTEEVTVSVSCGDREDANPANNLPQTIEVTVTP